MSQAALSQPLASVLALLHSRLDALKLVYLFGSRAQEDAVTGSDWDIAIVAAKKLAPLERWQLQEDLAGLLNADIDLVDLLEASTVLQMQVVTKGRLLLGTEQEADAFAMQVYSMYGNLQEGRAAIVNDFIEHCRTPDKGLNE